MSKLPLLYFSFDFDTVDHSILIQRIHTHFAFTNTHLPCFSSYLTDCSQYVSFTIHCTAFTPIQSDVHPDSVRVLIFFTMYIKSLYTIIDSHCITHNLFTDKLKLQMSAPPDITSELFHHKQSCISVFLIRVG